MRNLLTETDRTNGAPPPPEWPAQLRAQGQTIAWLARELGISRAYLSAVASGHRQASAELSHRIAAAINGPDRLRMTREYAAERVAWIQIRDQARALAEALDELLAHE